MTGQTGGIADLSQGQAVQTVPQKFILPELGLFDPGGGLFPILLQSG